MLYSSTDCDFMSERNVDIYERVKDSKCVTFSLE